jgi:hypothetical protein
MSEHQTARGGTKFETGASPSESGSRPENRERALELNKDFKTTRERKDDED